jgi:hypothetical protein
MRKRVRNKQRRYYSSDGKTFWSCEKGTGYAVWLHMVSGKRFPHVLSAQLEIPNSLFIFDIERI